MSLYGCNRAELARLRERVGKPYGMPPKGNGKKARPEWPRRALVDVEVSDDATYRVYRALVRHTPSTARALAKQVGLGQRTVNRALNRLQKDGRVRRCGRVRLKSRGVGAPLYEVVR